MGLEIERLLLTAGVLTVVSVLGSRFSSRLGVPALLLFLAIGMFAGSEGVGGIHFDDPALAQGLGIVALLYILFAGGLETRWSSARAVALPAIGLATIGVLLTALATAAFAWLALGLDPLIALMLGGIVSSTDAAAVFATFTSQGVALKGRLRALLEFESGSNDPMAVFLTTTFVALYASGEVGMGPLALAFVRSMGFGLIGGVLFGFSSLWLLNRVRLQPEGLYPVLTLGLAPLIYALTDELGGNGFLAVYVAGVVMSSRDMLHRHTIVQFHDGLAWLMQITMFVTLGLLVFPSRLAEIWIYGALVALFLIFVARPVGVFFTLAPSGLSVREQLLVSWVGLRGAVPIVLATFPLLAGVPESDALFDLVFFIVLISALLQGATIVPVARWLRLDAEPPAIRPVEPEAMGRLMGQLAQLEVPGSSPAAGRAIIDLGIPRNALILLIFRGREFVLPRGVTTLAAGDRLLVLAQEHAMKELAWILGSAPEPYSKEAK